MSEAALARPDDFEGNPLLEEWMRVHGPQAPYDEYVRDDLLIRADPHGYVHDGTFTESFRARRALCALYAFAVPSEAALDLLAGYGRIVEVGAGTGYWARLLRDRGADVLAFDLLGEAWRKWFPDGQWGGVERGGVEQAGIHADRTLFVCWPPMSDMAARALTEYEAAGGTRLVYVGEGHGGCTADDEFFEMVEPGGIWTEVVDLCIPQWAGIHDRLLVYERI